MKKGCLAILIAAGVAAAHTDVGAADAVRFRFVTAVSADENGAGMKLPEGIACDGKGGVIAGDTGNDRLLRFRYADRTMSGGTEIKLPELSSPGKIQLDSKGDIYALDGSRHRVVHLGSQGEFKGTVAYEGVPAPATVVVKSFAMDASDSLYLLDTFAGRVIVLDPAGRFSRAIALPPDARFVSDVAVDTTGTVVALDSIGRRVFAAAPDASSFSARGGDLSSAIATLPSSIAVVGGTFVIVEAGAGTIVTLARDGTFLSRQLTAGRAEGSLAHPAQMCITATGEMFIADRDNARVQVFAVVR